MWVKKESYFACSNISKMSYSHLKDAFSQYYDTVNWVSVRVEIMLVKTGKTSIPQLLTLIPKSSFQEHVEKENYGKQTNPSIVLDIFINV